MAARAAFTTTFDGAWIARLMTLVGVGVIGTATVDLLACQGEDPPPTSALSNVRDERSGLEFPRTLAPHQANQADQTLVGVGTRTMTVFQVYTYSVGLYMDVKQFHEEIHAQRQTFGPTEVSSAAFTSALLAGHVDLSLRLTPYRQTDFSHLRDGLAKALESRNTSVDVRP